MPRSQVYAGIDIGSTKITTLIVAPSQDEARLNVIGVASTPSSGIRKSQVVDIDEAVNAITASVEAAERMAGYSLNSAFVAVSGDHVQSQNSKGVVAVGNPDGEISQDDVFRVIEAARAISLPSSREVIHVIPREFIVDSQPGVRDPVGMSGVRLESDVHIISGASGAMRNLSKCVNEVGIDVQGLVFSGLASAQAVLSDTEKELGVILVDIGGGTTSVAVFVEGALAHSAVLPVGAKNITNDLAIGLRVSLDSAEKIKQYLTTLEATKAPETGDRKKDDEIDLTKLGLKEEIKTASRKTLIDGIVRPRLNEIFILVGEEVKRSGFAGATPAGVVITGGGAETVEIVSSCKRTLQLATRIGIPKGLFGLVDEINSPAYASTIGLVLYAASQPGAQSSPNLNLGKMVKNIPAKGLLAKAVAFIKSLLP